MKSLKTTIGKEKEVDVNIFDRKLQLKKKNKQRKEEEQENHKKLLLKEEKDEQNYQVTEKKKANKEVFGKA